MKQIFQGCITYYINVLQRLLISNWAGASGAHGATCYPAGEKEGRPSRPVSFLAYRFRLSVQKIIRLNNFTKVNSDEFACQINKFRA